MLSYCAPRATLQQVLQRHPMPKQSNTHVTKVTQRIRDCRTATLGHHVYQCSSEECGYMKYQYHPFFPRDAETGIVPIVGLLRSNDKEGSVTFDYKDYNDSGKKKQMTSSCGEFIRCFEQHILPERFSKIRTYGYLANRGRHQRINEGLRKMKLPLRKGLVKVPMQIRMPERFGIDVNECPCCKSKSLKLVKVFYPWKHSDDG